MHRVEWKPRALEQLASIYTDHPKQRRAISAAANQIDPTLARMPMQVGESRGSPLERAWLLHPLAIQYDVLEDVGVVYVLSIRCRPYRPKRGS